jgi:antitoxin component YwqK of YwqJK toxin-antitoxin module
MTKVPQPFTKGDRMIYIQNNIKKVILILLFTSISLSADSVFNESDIEQKSDVAYLQNSKEKVNGTVNSYYKSGQVHIQERYQDGKLNGARKVFNESGILKIESHYKEGLRDGMMKQYDNEGILIDETMYQKDHPVGVGKSYFDTGELWTITNYVNCKKQCVETFFYKSGAVHAVRYGECYQNSYYESGELEEKEFYDTKNNCIVTTYYKSGIHKKITINKDYERNVIQKFYAKSGRLQKQIYWEQHIALSGSVYNKAGKKLRNMSKQEIVNVNKEYKDSRPYFTIEIQ